MDARPVDGDDYSSKVKPNPLVPKLVIELDGERAEFLAYANPNQWALMKNAEAVKANDRTASMAAMFTMATTSIIPGPERLRFDEFMTAHGQDEDLYERIGDALNLLWSGQSRLPLEPMSSDSSASTGEPEPTSTDDSSEPEFESPDPALGPPVTRQDLEELRNLDWTTGSSIPV